MTHVDLEDRAPGGESKAFLAVADVLVDALLSPCSAERLDEVANRVCEALEGLGRQQAVAEESGARLAELQQHANELAAAARARRAARS